MIIIQPRPKYLSPFQRCPGSLNVGRQEKEIKMKIEKELKLCCRLHDC